MKKYLIENEEFINRNIGNIKIFHVDCRIQNYAKEIVKDLKEKNYKHKRKFSFAYMCKHDYFYLDCGIILSISYASNTLFKLQNKNLEKYKFQFDLNPFND